MRSVLSPTLSKFSCLLWLGLLGAGCKSTLVWDVKKFGATGNGETLETMAIQGAIDACHDAGGGEVWLPAGTYVSGTLLLKDGVTLHLAENARLQSSLNPNHFESIDPFIDATGQYRGQCLIGAIDAKNIGIKGKGVIDGRGDKFTPKELAKTMERLGEKAKLPKLPKVDTSQQHYVNKHIRSSNRPFLIRLVRCEGIEIEGVELRQPAAWTLHFYQCKDFLVRHIRIFSHANRNNDGIDIDSSSEGLIEDCEIDSGDDAICFKTTSPRPTKQIKVRRCRLKSDWGAIKFGTESMGDFRDIDIRDCQIHDTKGGGIKILSVDGAQIRHVVIDQIEMENTDMPLFIRLGERRLTYRDAERQAVGKINGISISNVKASTRSLSDSRLQPPSGIFITGTPKHSIGQVTLSHIHITLPGGGEEVLRVRELPENETKYPEFTFFDGPLPAYGLFARHINDLVLNGVSFELLGTDHREEKIVLP